MPRERKELIREKKYYKTEKLFVLAYEGNKTEPQYYEALKEKLKYKDYNLYIISLKRGKDDTNNSPKHVFNRLKDAKSEFNFKKKDEFWMIIDKDKWPKLDEWVKKCEKEQNFFIALSNPEFEFWLLLHVKNIEKFSQDELNKIYENKKSSKSKKSRTYTDKLLSNILNDMGLGGYNKSKIKPERFIGCDKKINLAIKQAKELDNNNIIENLGSDNYKLVQKLIN